MKQTLEDLSAMDCVADPTGFKATLESARTQRTDLVKEAVDIKATVAQIIKALGAVGQVLGVPATQGGQ